MTGERSQYQMSLDFDLRREGEALNALGQRAETVIAECKSESPTDTEQLLTMFGNTLNQPNRRMQPSMSGGVTGKAREGLPMSIRREFDEIA